jgi:vacuolar-type H+-ATPase subunit E/Vma4
MSSQKKAQGLPGMKEGPLVQMLDSQVQQAATDEAKKLVNAATLAAERLVDDTKEAEETATAAAAAAAMSAPEEAQVRLSGSTATADY